MRLKGKNGFCCGLGLLMLAFVACREPFNPVIPDSNLNLLVVEGSINTGAGQTKILLSRSVNISAGTGRVPENNAMLTIEGDDHSSHALQNTGDGIFICDSLHAGPGVAYRLHITTSSGEEYQSAFARGIQTPPVDSVNWTRDDAGVHIFVNSHSSDRLTRYYKYNFQETWELHSYDFSYFFIQDGQPQPRPVSEIPMLYYCWAGASSSDVLITSTAALSANVVSMFPLTGIAEGDRKIAVRYRIVVNQLALSAQAYDYYSLLKKNTQLDGSIFSSQPASLVGNIQTVKGGKPAIGFVSVASASVFTLFITPDQLKGWYYYRHCPVKKVTLDSISFYIPPMIATYKVYQGLTLIGYNAQDPECLDCRLYGSPIKPAGWPTPY